jgi:hypothetical protein
MIVQKATSADGTLKALTSSNSPRREFALGLGELYQVLTYD